MGPGEAGSGEGTGEEAPVKGSGQRKRELRDK